MTWESILWRSINPSKMNRRVRKLYGTCAQRIALSFVISSATFGESCIIVMSFCLLLTASAPTTKKFYHRYDPKKWRKVCWCCLPKIIKISKCLSKLQLAKFGTFLRYSVDVLIESKLRQGCGTLWGVRIYRINQSLCRSVNRTVKVSYRPRSTFS